jgi:hypothetical protein
VTLERPADGSNFNRRYATGTIRAPIPGVETLVITHNFARLAFPFFALKGRWILAGGEATGIGAPVTSRPDRGAGPGLKKGIFVITMARPAPLPGRKGNNDGPSGGFATG